MSEASKWSKPQPVTDLQIAFPANLRELMPAMDEIPSEFRRHNGTPWNRWQAQWFFRGLERFPDAKDGVDREQALRHLQAIQGSFEPKHEHKEAAVAYLASLWLQSPSEDPTP